MAGGEGGKTLTFFLPRPVTGGDDYAVPFDTQMLNADDDDLPYFNEDDEDEPDIANLGSGEGSSATKEEEPEDMLLATQGQLKRVRPENINYAKRAKRVDVKKLKDSIWRELEDVTIPVKEVSSQSFLPFASNQLILSCSFACSPQ